MKQIFKIFLALLILMLFQGIFYAQKVNISDLNYEEIEKLINEQSNQPQKVDKLINLYIKKSKLEHNNEVLLYAYRYASNFYKNPINLKYADSALNVGMISKNKKLLTDAYLNKGMVLMNESLYQKALDNILIANKYSHEIKNEYLNFQTIYFIAQNKIYLGLYEDANKELYYCLNYFRDNKNKSSLGTDYKIYYIYSLMSYIDSNTRIGKHSENKLLLKEAFQYINDNNLKIYLPYFISSEGTDAFFTKDYKTAISKLSEAIRLYNDQWPHISEIYYLGLTNWKLHKHSVSIKYLEEIDKYYNITKKLDPQYRTAYELLIKYNDSIGNRDKQLEYINKLMLLDRNYEKNFKYLYTKINKEYDTQKLIAEKNKIENSLKMQRTIISFLLAIALISFAFFGYRFYKLQNLYKQRFDEIISNKKDINDKLFAEETIKNMILTSNKSYNLEFYNKISGLNPLFVENILKQLDEFEKNNKFLDNQMSQRLLSENLGTNYTYLSKIINVYKGKTYNNYINDLRLDYLINLLKNDIKYLNYDVKDLALMAGFTSAINFSDNFQRKYEIKPSYFIKMMKENIKNHHQS